VTTVLKGLTFAQLRWMFTSFTDAQLTAAGLNISLVAPNDDGDGIKVGPGLPDIICHVEGCHAIQLKERG